MVFAAILLLTPIAHTMKWFRKEMILFIWLELYLERDFFFFFLCHLTVCGIINQLSDYVKGVRISSIFKKKRDNQRLFLTCICF